MSTEFESLPATHGSIARSCAADAGWRVALPIVVLACAGIFAVYWRTVASIVEIWERSETFAHGFLILPISVYLIWTRRREVAKLAPRPDYLGFALLAGAGVAWLVAAAGQVQVIQQYAVVAMIPAVVIAVAGREVAWALAFPLAFLLLGVPIGEALVPPLMDWTADFTVTALRLTGIPVFREGTFFNIPSGSWSVVEGCSGLRYLIASITVGVLYAYLSYQHLWKRLLFVVASVGVPILANGLRAYMIVMIAHLSNMQLALGVDHLIYGWVFFGLVMFLLFWAGSFWRDPAMSDSGEPGLAAASSRVRLPAMRVATAATAALAIAAAWPLYAAYLDRPSGAANALAVPTPAAAGNWVPVAEPLTDWRPRYTGAATSSFQVYRNGEREVALYLGLYRNQQKGAELLTSTNVIVPQKHPVWSNIGESRHEEDLGSGPVDIRETQLRSPAQRLLVWDWYRLSGQDVVDPYAGKLLLARDRLLGRGDDAAAIILATPYEERPEVAEQTLRQFVREMLPSVKAALTRAGAGTRP